MRTLVIAVTLVFTVGCGGNRVASNATPAPQATLVTPTPAVPVGSFVALDYQKPGQPTLTSEEVASVRKTLAAVKPCQQGLLRYSFDNSFPQGDQIDLYFEPADPHDSPHVLWERNSYYDFEEGHSIPFSYDAQPDPDWSIQADIANVPCR